MSVAFWCFSACACAWAVAHRSRGRWSARGRDVRLRTGGPEAVDFVHSIAFVDLSCWWPSVGRARLWRTGTAWCAVRDRIFGPRCRPPPVPFDPVPDVEGTRGSGTPPCRLPIRHSRTRAAPAAPRGDRPERAAVGSRVPSAVSPDSRLPSRDCHLGALAIGPLRGGMYRSIRSTVYRYRQTAVSRVDLTIRTGYAAPRPEAEPRSTAVE